VSVSLDFDPFVSNENSQLLWEGGRYHLADIPGSRNGTALNFGKIPSETPVRLRDGDIIGVGHSLLVFRGARAE
jgi:pSer/pThr/pTyr-binding forkhead associated (FHA) protein